MQRKKGREEGRVLELMREKAQRRSALSCFSKSINRSTQRDVGQGSGGDGTRDHRERKGKMFSQLIKETIERTQHTGRNDRKQRGSTKEKKKREASR
jgi:hypothetical protein